MYLPVKYLSISGNIVSILIVTGADSIPEGMGPMTELQRQHRVQRLLDFEKHCSRDNRRSPIRRARFDEEFARRSMNRSRSANGVTVGERADAFLRFRRTGFLGSWLNV
jgi:hypothetical protein